MKNLSAEVKAIFKDMVKCPMCPNIVGRDTGCNALTCTNCNHKFCWEC